MRSLPSGSLGITRALAATALAALLAPAVASADRGALTLDAGAVLSGSRIPPGAGEGAAVAGTVGGISLGVRYALRNDLELSVRGEWFKPAPFFQDGTTVRTADGAFVGQAQARVGRQTAAVGIRYVRGLVWRLHAGLEVGWTRISYGEMDLVDMSNPGTPKTFGLVFGSPAVTGLGLSPFVGVEWAVSDRLSLSVMTRLDVLPARLGFTALTVPFTLSWSWYGLGG